ncbi:MAG: LysM peptidoglycan-binding domain-containing protein [Campylobacterota bacterium]|nr:LysM peptidoglycan-binding domain-containing protein [Campylobacterota bacterium]
MFKNYLIVLLISIFFSEIATAKVINCRVITNSTNECTPYGSKFLKAKEIKYRYDRKKLIVEKTLSKLPEKRSVKIISVEEMNKKYLHLEDSIRFKGTVKASSVPTMKERIYTRIERIKAERKKLFDKMNKIKEEVELKKKKALEKIERSQGEYLIEEGDNLGNIAKKFNVKVATLKSLNKLNKKFIIRVGKKLIIPYSQERVDAIASAEYVVKKGDSLSLIAKDFNLTTKAIMKHNRIKKASKIRLNQVIRLPLPYVMKEKKKKRLASNARIDKKRKSKFIRSFGKRKLRVTATAYSSHVGQTDSTPFLAAWNNRLRPGMKIIAVSRDMLTRYGMRNGTKVRISGLPGYYRVRDKMNKRYRKRIDIYMGVNRRKALRWGRRSVVIHW